MSTKITPIVWNYYSGEPREKLTAVYLADRAHSDGSHIFPAIKTIAKDTRQSERTIQRQLKKMVGDRWLLVVDHRKGGRKNPTHYCINPEWLRQGVQRLEEEKKVTYTTPERVTTETPIKGDTKTERVTTETERVTPVTQKGDNWNIKGDTAVSPESYSNRKEALRTGSNRLGPRAFADAPEELEPPRSALGKEEELDPIAAAPLGGTGGASLALNGGNGAEATPTESASPQREAEATPPATDPPTLSNPQLDRKLQSDEAKGLFDQLRDSYPAELLGDYDTGLTAFKRRLMTRRQASEILTYVKEIRHREASQGQQLKDQLPHFLRTYIRGTALPAETEYQHIVRLMADGNFTTCPTPEELGVAKTLAPVIQLVFGLTKPQPQMARALAVGKKLKQQWADKELKKEFRGIVCVENEFYFTPDGELARDSGPQPDHFVADPYADY